MRTLTTLTFDQIKDKCLHKFRSFDIDTTCLLLCGSYAEGFQNTKSDIDLILITSDYELTSRKNPYIVEIIDGIRAEILTISPEYFSSCLEQIQQNGFTNDRHRPYKFIRPKIVWGESIYQSLIKKFDFNTYQNNQFKQCQQIALTIFEDISGICYPLQIDLILMWQKNLVNVVVDAFLCSKGDLYLKSKWRLERARRTFLPSENNIFKKFKKFSLGKEFKSIEEKLTWIKEGFIIIKEIQLVSLFPLLDRHQSLLSKILSQPIHYEIEWFFLGQLNNSHILYGIQNSYQLDNKAALIFLICYGLKINNSIMSEISTLLKSLNFEIDSFELLSILRSYESKNILKLDINSDGI